MMTMKERVRAIGSRLWKETNEDWALHVSVSLTEPTCPMARIVPDTRHSLGCFASWGDTMDEAINESLARVEMWLNGFLDDPNSGLVITNPGDAEFLKAMRAAAEGEEK